MSNDATVVRKAVMPHEQGLSPRRAVLLATVANQFRADVVYKCGDAVVNGKSLLGLISLGASHGALVTIIATGDDAKEAVATIEAMLQSSSSASVSECLAAT